MKIAVLMTCHNRVEKTLLCLQSLFKALLPKNYKLKVFLVDDGSTDDTSKAVSENFPQVNIILGDGNLFWNQGMRLAWSCAVENDNFDYFLWLNDDTIMDSYAVQELLECHKEILIINDKPGMITGACRNSIEKNDFSYGGRDEKGPVFPNGNIQKCKYINGNIVLIPKDLYLVLGNFSNDYNHAMGDYDYGLRSLEAGFECYTTKKYIATCPINEGAPDWCNPKVALRKRWRLFHSPLGLNIKEYKIFRKKFWPEQYFIFVLKAYIKCIMPLFYHKLSCLTKP